MTTPVVDIFNMGFDAPVTQQQQKPKQNINDILGLMNELSMDQPTNPIDDIFGTSSQPTQHPSKSYPLYNKNGLIITLTSLARAPGQQFCDVLCTFKNNSQGEISAVVVQVAVPKTLKLMMQPASASVVRVGAEETQLMRIENPSMVC